MEPNNSPQDVVPQRSVPGAPQRPAQRRVFSDFTTRPVNPTHAPTQPARPATAPLPPNPAVSSVPTLAPAPIPAAAKPMPQAHTPFTPSRPIQGPLPPAEQPTPPAIAAEPLPTEPGARDLSPHPHHKPPKQPTSHIETAHAGLVGLIVFMVLTGLLVSPFIPGKTFESFPGSSQGSSSGDQSLACLNTPGNVTTTLVYNSRAGSPITYTYSTTTTQHATCDGTAQSAVSGRASQFNPLGLLIDVSIALIVSVIAAKIWRRIFGSKD